MRGDYPRGLRKWFLPSDIRNCNYTSNVLTANYASTALQVCLGTLKAGIEMETLRKQGTPENCLQHNMNRLKQPS
jgi:ABC-2 type transport system permease protein